MFANSEVKVMFGNSTRWTTPAFNVTTRVKPAKKQKHFWNEKHSAPSECVIIKPSDASQIATAVMG